MTPASPDNEQDHLPYWQVNVPKHQRTDECPPGLRGVSDKDRAIIGTPNCQYQVDTWPVVQKRVADNKLDEFRRSPSGLRAYRIFSWRIKQEHESVEKFVLGTRLHWPKPVVAKGKKPFEDDDDVKILWNDWPYGIDGRIVHLVVWTKFELEEDPLTKDLADEARAAIDTYVRRVFSGMDDDHVVWFKNWRSIKSVHALEHFHVMLFEPDPKFVKEITNGDVPLFQRDAQGMDLALRSS
ncbi:hypothetical protein B0T17DRAFT_509890 [Bombardia bombarda]|uniref:N-acetylglucosamine-induced protein 1 n=1 Tax=Bombardia bombarda TaxID=252184 RepID=A0AA39WMZ8_9PEZI|nr:hypothetical protein B0T17DRAFT_509890 [Bombardia bombarda]